MSEQAHVERPGQTGPDEYRDRVAAVRHTAGVGALFLIVWTTVWLALLVRTVTQAMLAPEGEGMNALVWTVWLLGLLVPYAVTGWWVRQKIVRLVGRQSVSFRWRDAL
ncbi:hypothetical protein CCUG60884_00255 [Mycobacteroides salmoniphilum]|uniref:Uncharacterized protein n=1 Tax=Mycobacteroides salmoniphilum TaxID=404941 RepID=A0A4R8T013_9MYCO|nr:hypothetical protein CCUG60884_00255 [Mycobacteroides salmoniphilum]